MAVKIESLDDLRVLLLLVHQTCGTGKEIEAKELEAAAAVIAPELIAPSPELAEAIPKISEAFARHKKSDEGPPSTMPASTMAKDAFRRFKRAYDASSEPKGPIGLAFASFIVGLRGAAQPESASPFPAGERAATSEPDAWEKLKQVGEGLQRRVAGNGIAIEATLDALARLLVRRGDKDSPRSEVTSLLFVGPPGVGKTSLGTALSAAAEEAGFSLPCRVISMSRYTSGQDVAELTGYGSHFQGGVRSGRLTGWVADRKGAPCVVVLDEIDRACIPAQNLLLELLGEGRLTDTALPGQPAVDFSQVLVIMTSNAGETLWGDPGSSGLLDALDQRALRDALRKSGEERRDANSMSSAFLDRVDQIVVFRYFTHEQRRTIAGSLVDRLGERLTRKRIEGLEIPPTLLDHIALHAGVFATGRSIGELVRHVFERPVLRRIRCADKVRRVSAGYADPDQEQELARRIASCFPCILHVDDHQAWRDHVAAVVEGLRERYGASIRLESSESVAQARQRLADGLEPSIVLLDLCFPDEAGRHEPVYLPGLRLLAEVRRKLPGSPVVIISSQVEDENDEMYARCVEEGGAAGFVPKTLDRFERCLEQSLLSLGGDALARNLQSSAKRLSLRISADVVDSHLRLLVDDAREETSLTVQDAGWFEVQAGGTRFEDLCGINAIVQDLRFAVDILREPRRFAEHGVHPPRGVLLHGPPGTGKTSIARALATEASAMFVSCVATQFERKFVGEGPARVRELFRVARRYAPVIVFIDEIDSFGRRGDDGERAGKRSLLNTLLSELDGFRSSTGVLVVGATNRLADLDDALVRPGRFGKKILVDRPVGEGVLRDFVCLYFEKKGGFPLSEETKSYLGRLAIGMSPAEIAEWARQTAWLVMREGGVGRNARVFRQVAVAARTAVLHGDAQATQVTSEADLRRTAVHEAGHAMVAAHFGMPIVQLTVIARGLSLGFLEHFRDGPMTRPACIQRLAIAFAGKEAEEIVLDGASTGAASDMDSALRLATNMVTAWGMGQDGIPRAADDPAVGSQVAALLEEARQSCRELIERERLGIESLASALTERKTLLGDEIVDVLGSRR